MGNWLTRSKSMLLKCTYELFSWTIMYYVYGHVLKMYTRRFIAFLIWTIYFPSFLRTYFVSFQKSLISFFIYFPKKKKKNHRNADFSSTDIGESGPSIQFVAVAFKHFAQTFYTAIKIENYFAKRLCNIFYDSKFSEITVEITAILLQ